MSDIYDTEYVEEFFDKTAKSYEKVNYVTSFGFSKRWRRQFVKDAVEQNVKDTPTFKQSLTRQRQKFTSLLTCTN